MSSIVLLVKSWVRSTISTEEEEDEAVSTEVKDEDEVISMTGRFSSMQVELQEAGDRKSQFDSEWNSSLEGKLILLLLEREILKTDCN